MKTPTLQTAAERLDGDRVKLRVEVPQEALEPAVAAAYKRWAKEIKVPGFRQGKVPRQIIDARVGPGAVFEEAIRDALPGLYDQAMRAEELQAIAPPDIEILDLVEGAALVFEATVDVRPDINLPDLAALRVEAPDSQVTDSDVEEQLERLRDRFAELETVGRDARRGDHVLIDLKGTRHDQPVEGAGAPDLLYEVGSRSGPAKLDEELEGNRAGAILKFNDIGPDGEDTVFTVLLKEVKAKKLPPLDDEFAKTVGEYETLDELKADLTERLGDSKRRFVEDQIGNLILEALVNASDLEAPEKLVESEFEHRLHHFEDDLKSAGLSMDEYGSRVQLTELEIRRDMRTQSARSVKAELLLEEVAKEADVQVTDEDTRPRDSAACCKHAAGSPGGGRRTCQSRSFRSTRSRYHAPQGTRSCRERCGCGGAPEPGGL